MGGWGAEPATPERQWIRRLTNAHNDELPELWRQPNYCEGRQPKWYMHPEAGRSFSFW